MYVNIYTICICTNKCMYICICVCIHVHVCHACIVCHEYRDTCVCLFLDHLDIILFVVSDKFAIAAMPWWSVVWAGSHELPPRTPSTVMFASHAFLPATSDIPLTLWRQDRICCFGRKKNRDLETKGVDQSPPGGPLPELEWNRNEGNTTVPIRVPGTIPRN